MTPPYSYLTVVLDPELSDDSVQQIILSLTVMNGVLLVDASGLGPRNAIASNKGEDL